MIRIRIAIALVAGLSAGCADLIGITDPTESAAGTVEVTALGVSRGVLVPSFDPAIAVYQVVVPYADANIAITATTIDPSTTITIGGATAHSATPVDVALPIGSTTIPIVAGNTASAVRTYSIQVVRQEPELGFEPQPPITGVGMVVSVASFEVDGNTKPDIVFTTYDGDVGVLINSGGTFVQRSYLPFGFTKALAVVDVTGDNVRDLLVSDYSLQIARGRGDGTFDPPYARAFADAGTIAIGTLDGDGRADVMVADGPGRVTAMLNDGANMIMGPSWQPSVVAGEPRVIVNAPLDVFAGDETIVLDTMASTISIFSYNSPSFPMTQMQLGAAAAPRELVTADFDRDGRGDIAWLDPFTGNVTVQSNFPTWTKATYHIGAPRLLTVGDVDGDGTRDLLLLDDQQLVMLRNDGAGAFTTTRFPNLGAGAVDIEIADLDVDGRQDLIFANQTSSITYARGVLR